MSPDTQTPPPPKGGEEKDISRKLKQRLLIAGGLVALALAAIPVLDHFGKRDEVAMTASEPQGSSGKIANVASAPATEPPAAIESSTPAAMEASQPASQTTPASPTPSGHIAPPAPDTSKTPGVAAIHAKTPTIPPQAKAPTTTPAPTVKTAPVAKEESKEESSVPPQAFKPQLQNEPLPAPAPVNKARPAGSSLGYKVQLGLFTSLGNAQKLVETLKANGIEAHTETKVHVGPFRTRAEAEETMNKLHQLGYSSLLAPLTQ
ncbi:Sporulation related domain-containing protein [Pseudogulbenkiania subflava DSM 22618]|uniref:Sporulation related domain-containing protein n=2 Tax=Pseudogulbenkiania subflava TaxID=451637 RepID=A0A1Y6C195_9NEIS|nr:Sporulation related domain-containing protein [Pseudogulbenkiania subflava DSM 22618]